MISYAFVARIDGTVLAELKGDNHHVADSAIEGLKVSGAGPFRAGGGVG